MLELRKDDTEQILLGIGKDLEKERDRLKEVKQKLDNLVVYHSILLRPLQ